MGRLRGAGLQSCGRRPRRPVRHIALLALAACCPGAVPTPASHFGYTPGDDYKRADTTEIFAYFHKLAAASDRIRLEEFGRSSEGRPMYVAFISAPENLKKLDHYPPKTPRRGPGGAPGAGGRRPSCVASPPAQKTMKGPPHYPKRGGRGAGGNPGGGGAGVFWAIVVQLL